MEKLAFLVTPYQAVVLHAALVVLETETEEAIHANDFIDDNKEYTDRLLTVMEMNEEAKTLKDQLLRRFGITQKK